MTSWEGDGRKNWGWSYQNDSTLCVKKEVPGKQKYFYVKQAKECEGIGLFLTAVEFRSQFQKWKFLFDTFKPTPNSFELLWLDITKNTLASAQELTLTHCSISGLISAKTINKMLLITDAQNYVWDFTHIIHSLL